MTVCRRFGKGVTDIVQVGRGRGGGGFHVKREGMLVRKIELNPSLKKNNLGVAQALFHREALPI